MLTKKMLTAACASLLLTLPLVSCSKPGERGERANAPTANSASDVQRTAATEPVRVSVNDADAAEPGVGAASDGSVFVAWVEHGKGGAADVWLSHFDAQAKPQGAPVRVNATAGEATAWHGDPPMVVVAPDNTIFVTWTAGVKGVKHASTLYLSASRDGGRSFDAPVKVNDDTKPAAHGMHSLAVSPDGRVYVAWLDERNVAPPPPAKPGAAHVHKESNREVFFAASTDGGRTFHANRRIASEVCPCCKTMLAAGADGRVYASWRQVLPGEFRHIAVAASTDGGQTFSTPTIVHDDKWQIAGCPVSGAALSLAANGTLSVLWYTAGEAGTPGLYRSESRDGGRTFAPRTPLARSSGRGTPVLLKGDGQQQQHLLAVWEERGEGASTRIATAQLKDDGQAPSSNTVAGSGELPVATRTGEQVFVAYVSETDARRSVWLVRAPG
jgi:BNR repeat-like domain